MKLSLKTLAVTFMLLAPIGAFAQKITSRGVVKDSAGAPVLGAAVMEAGTANGAITDEDGRFSISVPEKAILEITCLGYETKTLTAESDLTIILSEDTQYLDGVVVVGYGTIKRSTLANSVTSVKKDEFIQGAVNNPVQLLQGKVAGLNISTTSGDPNSDGVQMMLRGVSTLMCDQEPIIVVDGIIVSSLSNVSPDEVESVDVLKDGAAAAIYGTRGNNGVIIITTNRGKSNSGSISYHGYATVETISNKVDVFSAEEYRNLATLTDGAFTPLDNGATTDWQKEVFRAAVNHYHNINFNGGNGKNSYYANATINCRDGIMKGSNLNKYNINAGINQFFFNDKLQVVANLGYIYAKGRQVSEESVYLASRMLNPTSPVYNESTGDYTIFAEVENAVRSVNEFHEDVNWRTFDANGKMVYAPTDYLSFTAQGRFVQFSHLNGAYATRDFDNNHNNGMAWRNTSLNTTKTIEAFAQFAKIFGKHDVVAVAGYSYNHYNGQSLNTYNYDFPNDFFEYNNIGLGLALKDGNATMSSGQNSNALTSFFMRANYSFDGRYILAASVRADGSSKFGPDNRWGAFWSVSGAWRISQEEFMNSAKSWLDELKLKVSYGVTGVEPSSSYLWKQTYSYSNPAYMDGKWVYTISPTAVYNPALKWEEKHELNIGLDFGFLGHRLNGSVEYYNRTTKDLLYSYSVPMPPNLASTIYANVGSIANQGVELQLNGVAVKRSNFVFNISGNVSFNTNKILSLSNEYYSRDYMELGSTGAPVQKTTHIVREGGSVGDFYGWKSTGLKKNGVWIVENEDGTTGNYGSEESRRVIGNGIPKINAGLSFNASFYGFDVSIALRGAFMYQILNQYRMLWETFQRGQQYNYPKTILEHPYGGEALLSKTAPAYVSYFVEDGDHVKIDNVTVGYNFKFKQSCIVKNLRIYASGLNLYTFTKYKGIDPEVPINGLTPGVEYTSTYPTTRSVSLGVKLGF